MFLGMVGADLGLDLVGYNAVKPVSRHRQRVMGDG